MRSWRKMHRRAGKPRRRLIRSWDLARIRAILPSLIEQYNKTRGGSRFLEVVRTSRDRIETGRFLPNQRFVIFMPPAMGKSMTIDDLTNG